ncbi:HD domain-containing phosphohydrolase [Pseudaquabacterium pictum]|uniref:Two-component system response regulator n=1 Tax=Pseudaquabacterium pictum TaxID=2315236 RepID=A0A480AKL7_9BURK|nr:HD domain-containing phosphohydrolase [Rubrivivax pictus]GCL61953.1 two-component system response regulator [Rubrivivax pictus]
MVDPATAAPPDPALVQPPTVLLVDDEPSVLSALRRLFRTQGYRIEQATSGADALALMRNTPVDLVVSDMRMPGMDGAAFLSQVRVLYPGAVRILLTGYADITATIAAINQGAIHRYIAKPWDDNDLLLVVSDALHRRDLEQENVRLLALTQSQNQALVSLNQGLEARVAERTAALETSLADLAVAHAEVEAHFMLAVTVFSGLLELREGGMAGHARRVAELARRVAARLGLDENAQRDVQMAALLHDIGKIGFDDTMLRTPVSKYSADQLTAYQHHPVDGEAALLPLDKLRGVAAIVRQHHERWDGRGFPDGLRGPGILLGARILAAASDYDDLTSGTMAEHVYTSDKARAALRDGLYTHYDPQVVEALQAVLGEIEAEAKADVVVPVAELQPRMVLAADLLSPQGVILLPAGHVFQPPLIAKLRELSSRQSQPLQLRVLRRSLPAAGSRQHAPSGPGKAVMA